MKNEERRKNSLKDGARTAIILITILAIAQVACRSDDMARIRLPEPRATGAVSVEETIAARRSVRSYASRDISAEDLSQLLWACQGITDSRSGFRAAPSAGALYPLETYVAKRDGLFRYIPKDHSLEQVSSRDVRGQLASAAYGQQFVAQAPVDIILTAVHSRITPRYGERGIRYTDMEAGHAAENVFLQAVALGLGSVAVGAFSDTEVSKILDLPSGEKPLYILPVGYRK